MKKNFFFAILGLALVLLMASCSKSNTTPPASTTAEGKWNGNFSTSIGGPSHDFILTFKTSSVLLVEANNIITPDIANGIWSLVADSVKATYTYVGGTAATFSIAGKYSSNSALMEGTIGPGTSTSGTGTFTVTKQ